jgi:predicted alpha/beta-fold hydrolase
VITAENDPFVPSQPFRDARLAGNPHIDLRVCEHGGHCGFIGTSSAEDDGYWAENQVVEFVDRHAGLRTG